MEKKFIIPNRRQYNLHAIHFSNHSIPTYDNPLVILVHGYCGDKENAGYNNPNFDLGRYLKLSSALLKAGFDVLSFDLSGQGENIREPIRISHAIQDLEDVYQYSQRIGYKVIGTVGYSMGGLVSVQAQLSGRKVAVFWAPAFYPTRAAGKVKLFFYKIALSLKRKPFTADANFGPVLLDATTFKQSQQGTSDILLNKFTIPALILQGDSDPTVQWGWTKEAFEKMPCDPDHQYNLIPNAEHHFHRDILDEFIRQTVKFFTQYLK